jgi:hypothetical protein
LDADVAWEAGDASEAEEREGGEEDEVEDEKDCGEGVLAGEMIRQQAEDDGEDACVH